MKRFLAVVFGFVCIFQLFGCGGTDEGTKLKLYAPDGVALLSAAALLGGQTDFLVDAEIVKGAAIAPLILAGTPDIAIAPVNVCVSASERYTYLGTCVRGANFVVSRRMEVSSLNDLVGDTVYAFQANGTPGLTLKAAINAAGREFKEFDLTDKIAESLKINIEYLSDAAQVRTALSFGFEGKPKESFVNGLLSEPLATAFLSANPEFKRVGLFLDWLYPQAGIIVKTVLLEQNPNLGTQLLSALQASSDMMFLSPDNTADLVFDVLMSQELPSKLLVSQFIENSKTSGIVGFEKGQEAMDSLKQYYDIIAALPNGINAFGGKVLNDNFVFLG